MKIKMTPSTPASSTANPTDSPKLVSLLALATGAVAMPQTLSADIIYTDLNSSPALVGYSGGSDSFLFNLPGTVHLGFIRQQRTKVTTIGSLTFRYRTLFAADLGTILAAPGKFQGDANRFAGQLPY